MVPGLAPPRALSVATLSLLASLLALVATACGARSGLGAAIDGADEAPPGSHEADPTAPARDAGPLPPVTLTPVNTAVSDCVDAGQTVIYLIDTGGMLLRFTPPASFSVAAMIGCPAPVNVNSMAVDHTGTAYVGYGDGRIFRVNTVTGACQSTAFVPGEQGFQRFGMGFTGGGVTGGETLYLAQNVNTNAALGSIDTTTFALRIVGAFSPPLGSPELTGTGAGDLFAFYAVGTDDSAIGQVDRATARLIAQSPLPGVAQGRGWAFAFWGGDFYTFTAPSTSPGSVVHRLRPSDGSITQVATLPDEDVVVGAGVSICAPQR